tara:strand:+ start:24699 stop:25091 length:393 start_codon:yes stop_codon:yes gene_type:complete
MAALTELSIESARRARKRGRSRSKFIRGGAPADPVTVEAETRGDISAQLEQERQALQAAKELGLKTREQEEVERSNLIKEQQAAEQNRIQRLASTAAAEQSRATAAFNMERTREMRRKPSIVESIFSKGG